MHLPSTARWFFGTSPSKPQQLSDRDLRLRCRVSALRGGRRVPVEGVAAVEIGRRGGVDHVLRRERRRGGRARGGDERRGRGGRGRGGRGRRRGRRRGGGGRRRSAQVSSAVPSAPPSSARSSELPSGAEAWMPAPWWADPSAATSIPWNRRPRWSSRRRWWMTCSSTIPSWRRTPHPRRSWWSASWWWPRHPRRVPAGRWRHRRQRARRRSMASPDGRSGAAGPGSPHRPGTRARRRPRAWRQSRRRSGGHRFGQAWRAPTPRAGRVHLIVVASRWRARRKCCGNVTTRRRRHSGRRRWTRRSAPASIPGSCTATWPNRSAASSDTMPSTSVQSVARGPSVM